VQGRLPPIGAALRHPLPHTEVFAVLHRHWCCTQLQEIDRDFDNRKDF